jgi:hypothetical protein
MGKYLTVTAMISHTYEVEDIVSIAEEESYWAENTGVLVRIAFVDDINVLERI